MRKLGYLLLLSILALTGCKGKGKVVDDGGAMEREIAEQGRVAMGILPDDALAPESAPLQAEPVEAVNSPQTENPPELPLPEVPLNKEAK